MIYTNEQAKQIKAKQKRDAEAKTADLKKRRADAEERKFLKEMGL